MPELVSGGPRGPLISAGPFLGFLIVTAWAGASLLNFVQPRPSLDVQADVHALPRPELAKPMALGFDALAGDLYWVGALQYYAGKRYGEVCYAQLKEYLRLASSLAPEFDSIYRLAGAAVPCHDGREWLYVEDAVALLSEGTKRHPQNWFLGMLLSYNLTLLNRYDDAAHAMTLAAKQPGAPSFYAGLATRLMASTGRLDVAEALALDLLENASDEPTRATLQRRIEEIRAVRSHDELNRAVHRFQQLHGRYPEDLRELVARRVIESLPAEPLGRKWLYDSATGAVTTDVPLSRVEIFGTDTQ